MLNFVVVLQPQQKSPSGGATGKAVAKEVFLEWPTGAREAWELPGDRDRSGIALLS